MPPLLRPLPTNFIPMGGGLFSFIRLFTSPERAAFLEIDDLA